MCRSQGVEASAQTPMHENSAVEHVHCNTQDPGTPSEILPYDPIGADMPIPADIDQDIRVTN